MNTPAIRRLVSTRIATPLGAMLLVAHDSALVYAQFVERYVLAPPVDAVDDARAAVLVRATEMLDRYFAGDATTFDLEWELAGTPFQRSVWERIARIPHGRTITYAELASSIGAPRAVRAAGAATGRNPLSVLIPCHRVVGTSGALTGYAGGVERKRALLALEAGHRTLLSGGVSTARPPSPLHGRPKRAGILVAVLAPSVMEGGDARDASGLGEVTR
jgi:methylated-DNA-[protein]-cysteine S-methyltransferase